MMLQAIFTKKDPIFYNRDESPNKHMSKTHPVLVHLRDKKSMHEDSLYYSSYEWVWSLRSFSRKVQNT
jgi:hypothetical protein